MPFILGVGAVIDDLVPIIHKFPNGQDITAYPLFDLHVGSKQFNVKLWQAFKAKLLSEPDSYVFIGGDMMDNNLKSSAGSPFDAVLTPAAQKEWLKVELSGIKHKILCGTPGNHEKHSTKESDDNPLYDVFAKLDIEHLYRENACFVLLRFGSENKRKEQAGKTRPCYAACVTHGSGGGMYIGGSANKSERFGTSIDGLDLLLTGHTHRAVSFPVEKLVIDKRNGNVITQPFRVVTAASFLDYGGYAMSKMLSATAHITHKIIFSSDEKLLTVTS